MKFLPSHRNDILRLIESKGFDFEQFSFVKRKGRIQTIHNKSKQSFSYILKKETTVDFSTKAWVDKEYFEVRENDSPIKNLDEWKNVIQNFSAWLGTI